MKVRDSDRQGWTIDLAGRAAVVTGGTRGIGLETSRLFARARCDVAMIYRSRASDARRAKESVEALGVRVLCVRADLSREAEARRAIGSARRAFGRIDFLVNNAGIWPGRAVERISLAEWERTFAANMRSMFLATRFAVPGMKRRRFGRIVNLSSTAGQRGEAFHSDYAATKGAAISFTKSLCTELAGTGITVNAVAPGWVDTEMSAATLGDRRRRKAIEREIPTGRVASARDVAAVIVFLCSEYGRQIDGEVLNVNGGSVLAG
jgi:3-oxoacyl-[acyl-carrier protein] reductase